MWPRAFGLGDERVREGNLVSASEHDKLVATSLVAGGATITTPTHPNHNHCEYYGASAEDDSSQQQQQQQRGFTGLNRHVRFQVVVWYVGPIDVVLGLVTMKFRVTIFWNAPTDEEHKAMAVTGYGNYDATNTKVWTMHGRQRAYQRELSEILPGSKLVYVPPVSILNAKDFDVIGEPEICLVNETTRAMKWTCMYTASLIQEHMRVDSFPHDSHDLVLKLGILKHRQAGRRWDKNKWRFGLATEADSQSTIRIPHGLIVDHVKIPEFSFDPKHDFVFEIAPLVYGPLDETTTATTTSSHDECLQIRLRVRRHSGYYDKNIIPLLALLNVVGISTLTLEPLEFGSRGEIILGIAFVAIGIRLSVDSKLPNVGYQIKLQRILNRFFYTLLFMHIESSLIYGLIVRHGWTMQDTSKINDASMVVCAIYTVVQLQFYYKRDSQKTWL